MNFSNILSEIEKVDPEIYDKLSPRRKVMQQFTNLGGKLALAAIPMALGSMFKKAGAQSTSDIVGVLQFALQLEVLESEFYKRAVSNPTALQANGLTAAGLAAITTIRDHEIAHVNFLRTAISSLGSTPNTSYNLDFSGGGSAAMTGPYANVFTNYTTFLAVAQTFEDTGVRAYKGQAGVLIPNNDVITAALQIHSVEARHAAHIRYMRRNATSTPNLTIKPWITGNSTAGAPSSVQAAYNGEEVTTQAGFNIVGIGGTSVSSSAASEAFDEPLNKTQVTAIVGPFFY